MWIESVETGADDVRPGNPRSPCQGIFDQSLIIQQLVAAAVKLEDDLET